MTSPGAHLALRLRLIDSREIAPATRHFVFEVPDRETFGFVPGQFLSLSAADQRQRDHAGVFHRFGSRTATGWSCA